MQGGPQPPWVGAKSAVWCLELHPRLLLLNMHYNLWNTRRNRVLYICFLQFLCSISLPVLPMSLAIHIFDFILYVIGICILTFFKWRDCCIDRKTFCFISIVLDFFNISWECLDTAMLISEAPSILLACLAWYMKAMPAGIHLLWRTFVLRKKPTHHSELQVSFLIPRQHSTPSLPFPSLMMVPCWVTIAWSSNI